MIQAKRPVLMTSQPLKGKWIVVTRASHQSKAIEQKLCLAGAHVILFPLLAIDSPEDKSIAKQQLAKIAHYDLVIFVSANAVEQCFKHVKKETFGQSIIAAVGKKTAQRLEQNDINVDYFPQTVFNSEALLSLAEIKSLNASNRVAIIRGEGGRDLLKTSLQAQGVKVDYINVYKQFCPQTSLSKLSKFYKQGKLDIILLTSGNSTKNLFSLQRSHIDSLWLNHIPLMAGSQRIKQKILATTLHDGKVYQAEDPSDETLYQQLVTWSKNKDDN